MSTEARRGVSAKLNTGEWWQSKLGGADYAAAAVLLDAKAAEVCGG